MKRAIYCLLMMMMISFSSSYAMRCNNQLISEGDSQFDVLQRCGEPAFKRTYPLEISVKREVETGNEIRQEIEKQLSKTIFIEEWTYNFGNLRLLQIVTFRDGKVTEIKSGGYGYSE